MNMNPFRCTQCGATLDEDCNCQNDIEIHADAKEDTARQVWKDIYTQDRPDIIIAIILRAIDDWYKKGITHGKELNDDSKNI